MTLKSGPLPKYYQLAEILRRRILGGEWAPNCQLPTEEMLSQEYGISRGTVRQAITTLINEGLVRSEQGRGTFVNAPRPRLAFFTLTSFEEDMQQQNRDPDTRLLSAVVNPATPEVAERLALTPGEPVIHVVRLRLADEQPIVYERRQLAYSLCPGLMDEDLEQESVHWLLIHKHHIPMIRTVHVIEVRLLEAEEAGYLRVTPGATAFFVDRLTYTLDEEGERPAVWYQAFYRGDDYHFKAEFHAAS